MAHRVSYIDDAGVPLGPLGEPVTAYRAQSGRVVHLSTGCRRARGKIGPVEFNLSADDPSTLCGKCSDPLPGDLGKYHSAAEHAAELVRVATTATLRTWRDVAQQRAAAAGLFESIVRSGEPALVSFAAETMARFDARVAAAEPVGGVEGALRRCAAALIFGPGMSRDPSTPSVDTAALEPRESTYHSAEPVRAAWHAWVSEVAVGESYRSAAASARSAAREVLGDAPVSVSQIPDHSKLDGSMFASPKEWATAEWSARVDETLRELTDLWAGLVQARLAEPGARDDTVLAIRPARVLSYADSTAEMLAPFASFRDEPSSTLVTVVPNVVAQAVADFAGSEKRPRVPAAPGDLELAPLIAGLWSSDRDAALFDFAEVVSTARSLNAHS